MTLSRNMVIGLGGIVFFAGFIWFIISLFTNQLGRVLPLSYRKYRATLPAALGKYRWKIGSISTAQYTNFHLSALLSFIGRYIWKNSIVRNVQQTNFQLKFFFQVEVFSEGLLASAMGRAVWLPYTKHAFTNTSSICMSKITIDGIPVAPTPLFGPFNFFRPTTTLTLFIDPNVGQEIVRLREEAVQRERNQPAV